ncbi:MBL fold metallo-hydrolase [Herbihabitans rhizosphaerae]|uniref:MBL fold metallo-hydrolase n=1 Tax=Herbihabitans rhizosphaerae TaxID=1872711 RepID=UPI00102CC4FA|nr:MBL fold metallo-hydrolase [Herbihabitans rhizosphaerae]
MSTVTVLGGCGAWPEAGRACSGFLVSHNGFDVVVDLGYATLPRLLAHRPGGEVDAVVITHEHPDHCVDLTGLARVRAASSAGRIPLYCTPGVVSRNRAMEPRPSLDSFFEVHSLPGAYQAGPLRLESWVLPHHVLNVGVRLSFSGLVVAFTGDTGPDPALAELGAGADLFVVDSTWVDSPPSGEDEGKLMTAREAGVWADRAGARRLLLTHFWPGADRALGVARARLGFAGEIFTAEEDLVVSL